MEEYLQYMKTLHSYMNDAEDQAAITTIKEQMQLTKTYIFTLGKDMDSVASDLAQVKEDTEKMNKLDVEIGTKILEIQKKIGESIESEISRLTQTSKLIRQEIAKLSEIRVCYSKVAELMSAKFMKQQVKEKDNGQRSEAEGKAGVNGKLIMDNRGNDAWKNSLITKLDSAKAMLEEIHVLSSEIHMDIGKIILAFEDIKCRENDFKSKLKADDITALEVEYNALELKESRKSLM